MSTTVKQLLVRIERHIKNTGISASDVGAAIINDTSLVFRMRAGGGLQSSTIDKANRYLDRYEKKRKGEVCSTKRGRAA